MLKTVSSAVIVAVMVIGSSFAIAQSFCREPGMQNFEFGDQTQDKYFHAQAQSRKVRVCVTEGSLDLNHYKDINLKESLGGGSHVAAGNCKELAGPVVYGQSNHVVGCWRYK